MWIFLLLPLFTVHGKHGKHGKYGNCRHFGHYSIHHVHGICTKMSHVRLRNSSHLQEIKFVDCFSSLPIDLCYAHLITNSGTYGLPCIDLVLSRFPPCINTNVYPVCHIKHMLTLSEMKCSTHCLTLNWACHHSA